MGSHASCPCANSLRQSVYASVRDSEITTPINFDDLQSLNIADFIDVLGSPRELESVNTRHVKRRLFDELGKFSGSLGTRPNEFLSPGGAPRSLGSTTHNGVANLVHPINGRGSTMSYGYGIAGVLDVLVERPFSFDGDTQLEEDEFDFDPAASGMAAPASSPEKTLANRLGFQTPAATPVPTPVKQVVPTVSSANAGAIMVEAETEEVLLPPQPAPSPPAMCSGSPAAIDLGLRSLQGYTVCEGFLPASCRTLEQSNQLVEAVREKLIDAGCCADGGRLQETQRILRYLLGTCGDVDQAVELLEDRARWRRIPEAARVARLVHACACVEDFPYFTVFQQRVPFHPRAMLSREGHPITLFRLGCVRIDELRCIDPESSIQLFRCVNEYLDNYVTKMSVQTGRLLGTITIFDFNGFQYQHMRKFRRVVQKILKPIVLEAARYYMEDGYQTFFLNVPQVFHPLLYTSARLWLDQRSLSKVTIASRIPTALRDMVEEEKLVTLLDGKLDTEFGVPSRNTQVGCQVAMGGG